MSAADDNDYIALAQLITHGFPASRSNVEQQLREYWEVRDRLSSSNGLILMSHRIVIPRSLCQQILNNLHAAHQGTTGMTARANQTIYWPEMNASIRNHRSMCQSCCQIAPSQSSEPLILTPPPQWPFQQICADYFENEGHSYLTIVDRFSYWINIYHFPSTATATSLLTQLRLLFTSYGVPEEIPTDGGPQFSSSAFRSFLKNWSVSHRPSSARYPQSNGRAELAVKTSKRIILDNTMRGSLDNDSAVRAILQYRNTPIQHLGLSPAQILFHRQLRDHMPNRPHHYHLHKEWISLAKHREEIASRQQSLIMRHHKGTPHSLQTLNIGDDVLIQDSERTHGQKRWIRTGRIVEALPFRQYRVKMHGSGRVSLRNRRFLKLTNIPHMSHTPCLIHPVSTTNDSDVTVTNPTARLPRALRQLRDFNQRGLQE